MKASKARKLTDSTLKQLPDCIKGIKNAAQNGQDHYFSPNHLNKATVTELQKLGYVVGNSEHQAKISW